MADDDVWTVAEAKANLSEVIDDAQTRGPQLITKHGKKAVVVVAAEQWERRTKRKGKKRKGALAEFFMNSPLRGSVLKIERSKDPMRIPDLR